LEANTQMLNSHSPLIAKLKGQVGQLANALNQRREGKLPSQLVANPRDNTWSIGMLLEAQPMNKSRQLQL